jgi:hypothetical protein
MACGIIIRNRIISGIRITIPVEWVVRIRDYRVWLVELYYIRTLILTRPAPTAWFFVRQKANLLRVEWWCPVQTIIFLRRYFYIIRNRSLEEMVSPQSAACNDPELF